MLSSEWTKSSPEGRHAPGEKYGALNLSSTFSQRCAGATMCNRMSMLGCRRADRACGESPNEIEVVCSTRTPA